jgi:cytidylate kinase
MIIAIDGPSGAGKSTVAKLLSKELNFEYIDTGAMYRAFAYKFYKNKLELTEENIKKALIETDIDYFDSNVYLDGENVEGYIRNEQISKLASNISKIQTVRERMVDLQRKIARSRSVVLDGRDITTVVFPNAEHKFYITASAEARADRRYNELINKGEKVTLNEVLEDINKRDHNDMTRENSPLKIADNAIVIDTSESSINEVAKKLIKIVRGNK